MSRTVFAMASGFLLLFFSGLAVLAAVVRRKFCCIIRSATGAVDHVDVHMERKRDFHIANGAFHSRCREIERVCGTSRGKKGSKRINLRAWRSIVEQTGPKTT